MVVVVTGLSTLTPPYLFVLVRGEYRAALCSKAAKAWYRK